MSITYRPTTDSERDTCIAAATNPLPAGTVPRKLLVAALAEFDVARVAYLSIRSLETALTTRADATQKEVDVAEAANVKAFRLWSSSVRDEDGKAVPSLVAKMLGGVLPGDFVRLTPREQTTRTGELARQVSEDPSLAGDLDDLDALIVARDVLGRAVTADEAVEADRTAAREQLSAAEQAFDLAWGSVARELKRSGAVLAARVPRFVRVPKRAKGNEESEEAATSESTTASAQEASVPS